MLCWFILIFSVLFTPPAFGLEFINPPPNNKAVTSEDSDFSKNSLFFLGSTVTIQWTSPPAGVRTSLTMFQQKGKTFLQPFEYLTGTFKCPIFEVKFLNANAFYSTRRF